MNTLKNPHIGSDFEEFLAEEGMLEESTIVAVKRVIAWQIQESMREQKISKKAMAERMHTSRSSLDRMLDLNDTSMTLNSWVSAAQALGKKIQVQLV